MKIVFDTGAAIHVCPFWFGENFPMTETTQKVMSASDAEIKGYSRRAAPLMFKESPDCCLMTMFLVCDVTTPILSWSQLLQQECGCTMGKDNMDIYLDEHFDIPSVEHGQRFVYRADQLLRLRLRGINAPLPAARTRPRQ